MGFFVLQKSLYCIAKEPLLEANIASFAERFRLSDEVKVEKEINVKKNIHVSDW